MYTYFKKDKKVLCVIQIVEDTSSADDIIASVMPHPAGATGAAADGSNDEPKYFYEMDTTGSVTATYNDINKDSVAANDTQD